MIKKRILDAGRIRRIDGSFSFMPHRFLTDGFLAALAPEALLLYFFWSWPATATGFPFTATTRSATCFTCRWSAMLQPATY